MSIAVSGFTSSHSISIDTMHSTKAKVSAARADILPVGSGRRLVRDICASMRSSSTWLTTAALAAARPTPRLPNRKASHGGRPGTASSVPTMDVNTMSMTTRGLVSS